MEIRFMSNEKREALMNQLVPTYTRFEEAINYMSHFVGALFGVFALVFFINHHINNHLSLLKFTSLIVYSVSMITLYFISFLYHFTSPASVYKRLLRKMDHDTIYFLILGTYFPVVALSFSNTSIIIIMIIELMCLIIGIALNFFSFNSVPTKIITTVLYVIMGWIIIVFKDTYTLMPLNSFLYILSGGILYTIGVIFYVLGKKKTIYHSVFHFLVLFATVVQFLGIVSLL